MVGKKVTNKNQPSIIRSSAAEYLTFPKLEENSVIQSFRITANSLNFLNLNHQKI